MQGRRWQDDVELLTELGIGATRTDSGLDVWDTAEWGSGALDDPLWSGLEPQWIGVDCERVVTASIRGGRENVWDSFDTGTATVAFEDEENRYAWHPEQLPDQLELRPGSPMRLLGLYEGERFPLYRGFVETIRERINGTDVIVVSLEAQDALGQLARVNNLEQSPVGANDLTHERVNRLLDLAQWPEEWRDFDTTTVEHQATTLAQPPLNEALLVVWTEGGAIYADKEGFIRLRSRSWLLEDPLSTTTQRVVGNYGEDVCPAEIEWSRAADFVVNDVSLARVGGTAQTIQDDASISLMGIRSWHRFDLSAVDDGPVLARADQLIAERATGRLRIDSIVIDAEAVDDWPFVLGVDYGWRIEVYYRHPVHEWEIVIPAFVQSVEHSIRANGWQVRLGVDDVMPYQTVTSRWDIARWDDTLAEWH